MDTGLPAVSRMTVEISRIQTLFLKIYISQGCVAWQFGVVIYFVSTLLQTFHRMCRWKNFVNRSIFGEDMDKLCGLLYRGHTVIEEICHQTSTILNFLICLKRNRLKSLHNMSWYLCYMLSMLYSSVISDIAHVQGPRLSIAALSMAVFQVFHDAPWCCQLLCLHPVKFSLIFCGSLNISLQCTVLLCQDRNRRVSIPVCVRQTPNKPRTSPSETQRCAEWNYSVTFHSELRCCVAFCRPLTIVKS